MKSLSVALRTALASAIAGAGASTAGAQPTFIGKPVTVQAIDANAVFAADLDGDGDTDLLSASSGDNKIAWYENDGRQGFRIRTVTTQAFGASAVFAADLDADGDLDIVSASQNSDSIVWHVNDGHQNFTSRTVTTQADGVISIFVADIDSDGDADVLSGSQLDDKIAWYENLGSGQFSENLISTSANGVRSVVAADIDGDGDTDALSASYDDSKISWYENDGSGSFFERTVATDAVGARTSFAVDLDRDGDTDIVWASLSDDKIAWHENDGNQGFSLRTISLNADGAFSVSVADLDADGDLDVLSASGRDDKVAWYENDGSQVFAERTISTSADFPVSVFVADVDSDGDTDVLSASLYDDRISWFENTIHQRYASFSSVQRVISIDDTSSNDFPVIVADIDGDGFADVAGNSTPGVSVWHRNNGDGSFTNRTIGFPLSQTSAVDLDRDGDTDVVGALGEAVVWYENDGSENFSLKTVVSYFEPLSFASTKIESVTVVDIDGDGDFDVAVGSNYNYYGYLLLTEWFENDGNENFNSRRVLGTGINRVVALEAVDIDSDGDNDFVETRGFDYSVSYSEPRWIAWRENIGNDQFTLHTIASGEVEGNANLVDIDSDGDIDVIANTVDGDVVWYENNGEQSFASRTIAIGGSIYQNSTADVDQDGDLDVLVRTAANSISWYENDGHQKFRGRAFAEPLNLVDSTIPTDLDGDGDYDVVAGFLNRRKLVWYQNELSHRSGAFDGVRTITADAGFATSVFAADIDRDGDVDVLSTSAGGARIALHENDGGQGFTVRTVSSNANSPYSVTAADVDGDGDLDVVSALFGDDMVAWHENVDQSFTQRVISTTAQQAMSVDATDMDNDGDIDVLSASSGDNKIAWYENDGSEAFAVHTVSLDAAQARSVRAVDLDRDGDVDILSASVANDRVAWHENDGQQNFSLRTISADADGAWSVFSADVDRDGDVDVLSASVFDNKIAWYENDGAHNFLTHTITLDANFATSVFAVDADNDGDVDVFSASSGDTKIAWYDNDGAENFTLKTISTEALGARAVFATDLDRDGDVDALSASRVDGKIAWYENCGGQFLFSGEGGGPTTVLQGTTVELLYLDFLHNGRAGDSNAVLDSISLQFTSALGSPLNTAQANSLIQQLRIYQDGGDGEFDAGDQLLATVNELSLTPAALTRGTQTIPFDGPPVTLGAPNGSSQLFVVADLTADAAEQSPDSFEVRLTANPRPQASDESSASVLSMECPMVASSGVVTPLTPPVDVSLSVSASSGSELGQTAITVSAIASEAVNGDQTVAVAVSGAGITGGDYVLSDTQITLLDETLSGFVTFTVADDGLLEGSETATLTLTNPSLGLNLVAPIGQNIVISDNDVASIAIEDISQAEGSIGTTTFTFTTTLTGNVQGGLTVPYALSDGTAVLGADYADTAGVLTFTGFDGETQSFDVAVVGDMLVERDETFTASLGTPSNVGVGVTGSNAMATIVNDDSATLSIEDVTAFEGTGGLTDFVFNVSLSAEVDTSVRVNYGTADGSASVLDSDYIPDAGSLTFVGMTGEQQTITISVIADNEIEPNETFFVEMSNVQANGRDVQPESAKGLILDDDPSDLVLRDSFEADP